METRQSSLSEVEEVAKSGVSAAVGRIWQLSSVEHHSVSVLGSFPACSVCNINLSLYLVLFQLVQCATSICLCTWSFSRLFSVQHQSVSVLGPFPACSVYNINLSQYLVLFQLVQNLLSDTEMRNGVC